MCHGRESSAVGDRQGRIYRKDGVKKKGHCPCTWIMLLNFRLGVVVCIMALIIQIVRAGMGIVVGRDWIG